ncbi:MAG: hypothetical protein ACYDB2_12240 [Acidimicrobiales bacterium]
MIVRGKTTTIDRWTKIDRWKVNQAGETPPTTTTTTVTPKVTPYTYNASGSTCTGNHVEIVGQAPEDIETCLMSGDVSGMTAGTFSNSPGGVSGYFPVAALGLKSWLSDYYPAPTEATSWTVKSVNNGNGTFTWNVTAYYAGLTENSTSTTLAPKSTPYTYNASGAACTGNHVVTEGQAPEDIETCLMSGDVSGMTAGTFSNSPGVVSGYWPVAAWGQKSWVSDYYPARTVATSWTVNSVNNGNGTFTWNMTFYYNGLNY